MLALITGFFTATETVTLFILIAVNLVTGIMVALITRTFSLKALGGFYLSRVLPFILGYALIYTFAHLGVATLAGPVWEQVTATVGLAPAVAALLGAIGTNLQEIAVRREPARDG